MAISAKDVMELRKQTDCGMMECKKALTEADGNFEKAIEILRERGLATAAKKASRVAAEGMVYADYCPKCKVGVVIEVNAETDFVAKTDDFKQLVHDIAMHIAASNPTYITKEEVDQAEIEHEKKILREQAMNEPKPKPAAIIEKMVEGRIEKYYKEVCLLEQPFVKDPDKTVGEMVSAAIAKIGEKISVRRFVRYEGVCSAYVHGGGTHGILVNFETTNDIDAKDEFVAYGKDIAMQVAAANPGYVDEASVPAEVVAKEKEIMLAQMAGDPKNANKPDAVKQKMIEGKIKKFFKENCLVDQEFVKDGDMTVGQYTAKVAKDLGGDIKIVKFTRFQKGEGLEKRADDFAAEVASMVK